jgi:hypothetical protein
MEATGPKWLEVYPDDEGDTRLRKVGYHLQDYTASQPRRPQPILLEAHFNSKHCPNPSEDHCIADDGKAMRVYFLRL